jgi:hypothetical protein
MFKDIPSSAGFRPLVGSYGCRRKLRFGIRRFEHRYPSPGRGRPGSYSTPVRLVRLAPPDGSSFVGIVLQVPVANVVSIPTRGWVSPGGSVMSEPVQRVMSISPSLVGGNKPPICFLCYGPGHFLAECPRLPAVLQKEAADNREAFQKNRPPWSRPPPGPTRPPPLETQIGPRKMGQSIPSESRMAPVHALDIRLYEGASFSPDRLHNRPEAARYLLTLVTACSDRDTHTLSKFS